jgi:hypothetical protein
MAEAPNIYRLIELLQEALSRDDVNAIRDLLLQEPVEDIRRALEVDARRIHSMNSLLFLIVGSARRTPQRLEILRMLLIHVPPESIDAPFDMARRRVVDVDKRVRRAERQLRLVEEELNSLEESVRFLERAYEDEVDQTRNSSSNGKEQQAEATQRLNSALNSLSLARENARQNVPLVRTRMVDAQRVVEETREEARFEHEMFSIMDDAVRGYHVTQLLDIARRRQDETGTAPSFPSLLALHPDIAWRGEDMTSMFGPVSNRGWFAERGRKVQEERRERQPTIGTSVSTTPLLPTSRDDLPPRRRQITRWLHFILSVVGIMVFTFLFVVVAMAWISVFFPTDSTPYITVNDYAHRLVYVLWDLPQSFSPWTVTTILIVVMCVVYLYVWFRSHLYFV